MRYIGAVLIVLAFCGLLWFAPPAKDEVSQLEGQIGNQYSVKVIRKSGFQFHGKIKISSQAHANYILSKKEWITGLSNK